jgi:UDP-N-acetyl-2-amino-2-deoxyglucuronate dehydrogenase
MKNHPYLGFGLVGCGKIAERHAGLLATGAVPGARLAAVCDVNAARAGDFAARHGVRAFTNARAMAADAGVDALTILTPSGLHAQNTEELAGFGKPIVVEKPMALTLADADRMIAACAKHGTRLFVVKQNRFNRPIRALRDALEAGRLGRLVLGTVRVRWCRPQSYYDTAAWRGTWRYDGGVLANQASHHIDLLEWMLGEVESVSGMATTALARIEAEDTAVATVRFANGALGLVEATTATRPKDLEGSLSVLGEKGSVVVGGFSANELATWNFAEAKPEDATIFATHGRNPAEPKLGYAHAAYYAHVVQCLQDGTPALVDGAEGRKSLAMLVALHESITTGRAIRPGDPAPHCRLGLG